MVESPPNFGGWETLEKLGQGGMCEVWRVRHIEHGDERAIKVLHDTSKHGSERFTAEARLLLQIDHPNVLTVHSLHADSDPPWIVMELLAGRDLDEIMHQGPVEPERAARLIADVASGLTAVHAMGVRHRDIKPANIMIGHDGVPRLIDFGIARHISRGHVTQAGFVVGTAAYLPPEVFEDESPQDAQDSETADVYALGQTLCEILTGTPVHSREGAGPAQLARIMKDKVETLHLDPRNWRSQVPQGLAEVVIRATLREPRGRTSTASAFEADIRGWLRHRSSFESAPVTRVNPLELPPPPSSKRVEPKPEPSPQRPVRREAPAKSSSGGSRFAALFGGLGTLLALLILAASVVGVGGLFVLRPTGGGPSEAVVTNIQTALETQAEALGHCGDGRHGEVVFDFVITDEKVMSVGLVSSTVDQSAVEQCLRDGLQQMTFPGIDAMRVRSPLQL